MRTGTHVVVVVAIAVVAAMAALGWIGEDHHPEKIEQLQVSVTPAGEAGLRITETDDYDFGGTDRHGPELVVPNDFGAPEQITASSPDAPAGVADVSPTSLNGQAATRIRIGDPDVEVSGQHRYTISYVLPRARFAGPDLSLDAVGADSDIPIEDVTVVYGGIELADARCTVGAAGSDTPCEGFETDPVRVELDRLEAHEGITISGEVTAWSPADPAPAPPLPERRESRRALAAGAAALLGAVAAGATYVASSRKGVNEVVGSGAAEAAHGTASPGPGTTRTVTDAELAEMATVEFAPPRGIEPWQGAAVLREDLDPSTVTAWFSGAIADDVLTIEMRGKRPRLGRGPKADDVDAVTADILRKLFGNREVVDLDGYDSQFASAWTKVEQRQDAWIAASGWWSSRPPAHHRPRGGGCLAGVALLVAAVALGLVGAFLAGLLGSRGGGIASLVLVAVGVPLITALVAYRPLLARRTANGSAYALQVASFRRFLVESEGQYVEWAWKNGLLRQYSAWAVALDAADAWKAAMERAGVPQPEIEATTTPLLLAHAQGALLATRTEPSTSSSSGSSGFSSGGFSGSVGGGGGGGSHGSW
ncbi:MAG: DUF2207 domain-containing protein [Acidimicrobiales bacterium]